MVPSLERETDAALSPTASPSMSLPSWVNEDIATSQPDERAVPHKLSQLPGSRGNDAKPALNSLLQRSCVGMSGAATLKRWLDPANIIDILLLGIH